MKYYDIFFHLFAFYLVATTAYLVLLAVASYFFRRRVRGEAEPLNIAVLIPAHNEESQIAQSVNSVLKCHYPKEKFAVIVIADNCTDNTAQKAKEAGALVVSRMDSANRGKGQALDWFFKNHEEYKVFAGIAIIDADTKAEPEFLQEVSSSLSHPDVKVVQGFYQGSNPEENWRTALNAAAWNVFNHLRPAGTECCGGTAPLKGNGMAFRSAIFTKYGWPAHSIVEDQEFSLILLLDDVRIHYNPKAVVYGEIASSGAQAASQRKRWEGGRFSLISRYLLKLLFSFLRTGRIAFLHSAFDLVIPPLSLVILALMAMSFFAAFFYPLWLPALTYCFGGIVFFVLSGQVLARAPFKVWLCLASTPLYILWKIPLYLSMMIKRKSGWQRTLRRAEMEKDKNDKV